LNRAQEDQRKIELLDAAPTITYQAFSKKELLARIPRGDAQIPGFPLHPDLTPSFPRIWKIDFDSRKI